MIRIKAKLDELFENKIELTDIKNDQDKINAYYTRALSALAVNIQSGVDFEYAAQSITDGYHDIGINAIYNDIAQKKLILVQSKWRTEGAGGITQEEAQTFVEGVKRILNFDFAGCNSRILSKQREVTDAIKDMDYQITMVFCHTGSQAISEYAERPINELLANVNQDDSAKLLEFAEIKQQDIYNYLADGQSGDNIIIDNVLLKNWGVIESPLKAYYGTIPALAIGEWYCRFGNRLFAKNIRFYKGSTDVNQGIKSVLKNEPDKFFYYNNGIKLLCKKISKTAAYSTGRETGLFTLEGVSLVNGAQTTGVIGSVYAESPEIIETAQVFVQMIDLGDSQEEQATQITKLSNTQNRIEGKDFASLDTNQERLRKELNLAGIQYLYKSGAKIDEPEQQISLDEAIVAQACALDDLSIVATAKRNVGALTETMEKAPYKLLFNGATNSFAMYNNIMVLRIVENMIAQNESSAVGRKRLVLVHGNRFLLHLIIANVHSVDGYDNTYLKKEQLYELIQPLFPVLWEKIYDSMENHFPEAYPAYIFKNVGRLTELDIK